MMPLPVDLAERERDARRRHQGIRRHHTPQGHTTFVRIDFDSDEGGVRLRVYLALHGAPGAPEAGMLIHDEHIRFCLPVPVGGAQPTPPPTPPLPLQEQTVQQTQLETPDATLLGCHFHGDHGDSEPPSRRARMTINLE